MSSKSNYLENGILLLIFNGVSLAGIADNDDLPEEVDVALHTANPGEAGDMTTSEANYTGYARATVNRTTGEWTVTGNAVENAAPITFDPCTAGANDITHFSIGIDGGDNILYYGPLGQTLSVSAGITPAFGAGEIDITED